MIKTSLKKTLSIISKNKYKIFVIFFLQIIFFITLSLIFYNTINPAMQHAKNAVDYYDSINMTESSGMFGYAGEDPLVIYRSYTKMMYYLKFMALYSILAFIIINGLLWAFSDNLVNKKINNFLEFKSTKKSQSDFLCPRNAKHFCDFSNFINNKKSLKQFLNYILNFGIISIAFILLFYLLIFSTLKSSLAKLGYSLLPLVGISLLLIVLIYFLFISFSLIDKRKIKEICRLTFLIGIIKFPKVILIYLINLIIILSFSYLLYLTIEANMIVLSVILILYVFSFVFTKLFLIVAVNDLVKKN